MTGKEIIRLLLVAAVGFAATLVIAYLLGTPNPYIGATLVAVVVPTSSLLYWRKHGKRELQ